MKFLFRKLRDYINRPILEQMHTLNLAATHNLQEKKPVSALDQLGLIILYKYYQLQKNAYPLHFKEVGFSNYSQHEEDGILLYIFALIGTTNKKCVEVCAGDGLECNTANLIIHHRWVGLLLDGDESNIQKAKSFYHNHPDTRYWPPKIVHAWITKSNVNDLIQENHFQGELDLLSLDIDGNDYWLLKELNVINPRVIVLEINHLWGDREAVTVPYDDHFQAEFTEYGSDYAGASLPAFVKLCKEKGYRLVGTNAIATNAFS